MTMYSYSARTTGYFFTRILAGSALALTFFALGARAQTQGAETKPNPETYQTLYLSNITQRSDANDVQTDLRNMLPHARMYYVASQNAISIWGTGEDAQTAQKILSEIDRPRKVYRLTYSILEIDNGKSIETRKMSLVVLAGGRTELKQGSRIPIVTATNDGGASSSNTQVQYMDVGITIEASLEVSENGVHLHTRIEQSSVADEKVGASAQDPVIRQTTLEGVSTLVAGKPLALGSIDIPGTVHHEEIEVVAELLG